MPVVRVAEAVEEFGLLRLPAREAVLVVCAGGMDFGPGEQEAQQADAGKLERLGRAFEPFEEQGANQGDDLLLPAGLEVLRVQGRDEVRQRIVDGEREQRGLPVEGRGDRFEEPAVRDLEVVGHDPRRCGKRTSPAASNCSLART